MAPAAHVYVLSNIAYDVYDLLVLVEVESLLREIAKANCVANVEASTVGLLNAQQ